MMFTPTSQQLLVACSSQQHQPANHSVPNLQLVLTIDIMNNNNYYYS